MRPNYLIASAVLLSLAIDSIAVLRSAAATPGAAATPRTVATPAAVASPGGNTSTGAVVGTGTGAGSGAGKSSASGAASRSNLLCAGLLGSGFLGNVLMLAPLPVTRKSDPNTAIEFTRIWSDSQHATVGGAAVPVSHTTPVVAVVKLPISFSPADRQKFEESGWKRREAAGGRAVSYCLESTGHPDAAGSSTAQGMICVSEQ